MSFLFPWGLAKYCQRKTEHNRKNSNYCNGFESFTDGKLTSRVQNNVPVPFSGDSYQGTDWNKYRHPLEEYDYFARYSTERPVMKMTVNNSECDYLARYSTERPVIKMTVNNSECDYLARYSTERPVMKMTVNNSSRDIDKRNSEIRYCQVCYEDVAHCNHAWFTTGENHQEVTEDSSEADGTVSYDSEPLQEWIVVHFGSDCRFGGDLRRFNCTVWKHR